MYPETFVQALTDGVDASRDLTLGALECGAIVPAAHHPRRIADAIAQAAIADLACGFAELARRLALFAGRLAGRAVEIGFELPELLLEFGLALVDLRRCLLTPRAGRQLAGHVGDLLLIARQLLRLPLRFVDVALRALPLRTFQGALRLAQTLLGRRRFGLCARITSGRPPQRVGGILGRACRFRDLRTLLFARQPLETASHLFELIGQRTLLRAIAAATALLPLDRTASRLAFRL